ncbi:NADH-quinone oxidoreductase subunit L [Salsipaludibacter albus]|uniref:NADH-quinone oxidoreductase subunit 5 family protein n=1 Tax=Salsipaludibacter albus TaxID=2849650 RepID=UPI001EE4534B|nr:proton-conducting transporter membrane subunit [Salsipaludibacter albus]MBY5161391.1 NADH-quinone oxidoreductase subunit L [Salsipaludibacter albus]
MIAWSLPLVPMVAGLAMAATGGRVPEGRRRRVVGATGVAVMFVTLVLAGGAVVVESSGSHDVGGGLALHVAAGGLPGWAALLVSGVATAVVAWAAAHEDVDGLGSLLGLLVAFVGAMLLLVVADDLVTLVVGWELVGIASWALIGHRWRDPSAPAAAAHAYNATRFGGLGIVLAAGATFAATGTVAFDAIRLLDGAALGVVAAGILLAAASKSALVPFSPWLFSAMAGPTAVSALLHSSTMVAAGAYALVRLGPALEPVGWFGPVAIAVGLVTALAGGVVALLQGHAKKLLAASTSAQYGLMVVAVGAGYPVVAFLHLAAHALLKAHLFLSAGVAREAVGSHDLARMRLGNQLRSTAWLAAVAALALAASPPLGAAWTKEEVLAAAAHDAVWIGLAVAVAGGLSAAYATRYHLLAFGGRRHDGPSPRPAPLRRPTGVEVAAMAALGMGTVALSVLWVPSVHEAVVAGLDGELPTPAAWELPTSLALVALGAYVVWSRDRSGRLGHVPAVGRARALADWLGLPTLTRHVVVTPTLALAHALAQVDDRVVDAGVRGVARTATRVSDLLGRRVEWSVDRVVAAMAGGVSRLADVFSRDGERAVDAVVAGVARVVERGGRDVRRLQTGFVHHQYVVVAVGVVVVLAAAILGR